MDQSFVNDIIQWDVRNWSRALRFWEHQVAWERVDTCLELGGRKGGLSLWLSRKGKNVVCSDIKDTRANAHAYHAKYGLDGAIRYEDIDATSIPYENHFDIVAFKSVLGGIGWNGNKAAQQTAIDQIHKALKPGGKLLFAENLTASPLHSYIRRRFVHWGESWRYVTLPEMREFLKSFSRVEMRTTGVLGTIGRSERQRQFLSAIDATILNRITPKSWRYIVYGIAEK